MSAKREGKVGGLENRCGRKPRFHFFWQFLGDMRLERDLLDGDPLLRHPFDAELASGKNQIFRIGLKQMSSNFPRLLFYFLRSLKDRRPPYGSSAAAKGADAARDHSGIAVNHGNVIQIHSQLVGHNLSERGLLPLPMRR